MTIFIAITLWLLNGQVHLEQQRFKTLEECMTYGQKNVVQLMERNVDVLYGSCHQVAGSES